MDKLLNITEVADELGRVSHTIRLWEYSGKLPQSLLPQRDDRGWRYWTPEQVEGIKQWIIDEDIRPGKGLANVKKKEPKIVSVGMASETNRS